MGEYKRYLEGVVEKAAAELVAAAVENPAACLVMVEDDETGLRYEIGADLAGMMSGGEWRRCMRWAYVIATCGANATASDVEELLYSLLWDD